MKDMMKTPNNTSKSRLANDLENNPCGICRPMRIKCNGHLKAAGGGNSGNGKSSAPKKLESLDVKALHNKLLSNSNWTYDVNSDKFIFDIAGAPLGLELNLNSGILRIVDKQSIVEQDKKDVKSFVALILNEVELFKQGLIAKGLPINNIIVKDVGKEIHILLGNRANFDNFTLQLLNKNLLPVNPAMKEELNNHKQPERTHTSPSPFSNRPRPKGVMA